MSYREDDGMDAVDLEGGSDGGHGGAADGGAAERTRRHKAGQQQGSPQDDGQSEEETEADTGRMTKRRETKQERERREGADVHDIAHPFDATHDCFDDFDGKAVQEPDDVKARRLAGKSHFKDQLKAFDSRAVFYASLFLFEWCLFLLWPPLFLAFCLVVVAPLWLFYKWWKQQQKECSLPTVVHAVGRGFYDVTFMMICASYGALIVGLIIIFWFYDAGAFKKGDDDSMVFTFYVFVIVPFVASEECLKAMFVRLQRKKLRLAGHLEMTRAHLIHSTGTSVGYALSQAMGWVAITHMALLSNDPAYSKNSLEQFGWMVLVGVLVTAFGTPLQLLSGYLIGLEVTRESWHWWSLSLGVPLTLRAAYYITLVGLLLLVDSTLGALALWFVVNVALCGCMLWRVTQVEGLMPAEYLRRVGYLRWGGYGVLEPADDDGDDGTGIQAGVGDAGALGGKASARGSGRSGGGGWGGDGDDMELQAPRGRSPSSFSSAPAPASSAAPAAAASAASAVPPAAAPSAASATRDSVLARLNAIKQANAAKAAAAKGHDIAPPPSQPAKAVAAAATSPVQSSTVNPMSRAAEEFDVPIDAEEVEFGDDSRAVL